MIYGGNLDGSLILVSTENEKNDFILDVYNQHIETITALECDSKERFLITGSKNGECIYWKITPEYKLQVKYMFYDHETEVKIKF